MQPGAGTRVYTSVDKAPNAEFLVFQYSPSSSGLTLHKHTRDKDEAVAFANGLDGDCFVIHAAHFKARQPT